METLCPLCIGYTALQTALTASCRWENDQATKKC